MAGLQSLGQEHACELVTQQLGEDAASTTKVVGLASVVRDIQDFSAPRQTLTMNQQYDSFAILLEFPL